MNELSKSLEDMALDKLEKNGSRLTKSRKLILSALEKTSKPLTVTQIAKFSSDIAQSSMYRNLTVLENAGLVTKIVNEHDFAFYELDEHVLGHHHHIRCTNCGTVNDVELSDTIEEQLDKTSKLIAKKYNFKNVEHFLDFSGLCANCIG
ncbi:MAG TPA: transcriptional repressor [Acidimicrobiia bacterium]|nr:transcriptional repressor [Acidimicrobiia bacterium]